MSVSETTEKNPNGSDASYHMSNGHSAQASLILNEAIDLAVFPGVHISRGIQEDTVVDTVADTAADTLPKLPTASPIEHIVATAPTIIYRFDPEKESLENHFHERSSVASGSKPLRKRSHAIQDTFQNVTNHNSSRTPYRDQYLPTNDFSQKRYPEDSTEEPIISVTATPGATFKEHGLFGSTPDVKSDHVNILQTSSLSPWSMSYSESKQVAGHWVFQPYSRQPSIAFQNSFSRQPSTVAPTACPYQTSREKFEYPLIPDLPDEVFPPPPPLQYRLSSRMGSELMEQPIIASPYPVVFYPRQQQQRQQHGYRRQHADCLTPPNSQVTFHPAMFSSFGRDRVDHGRILRHSYEQHESGCHDTTAAAGTVEKQKMIVVPPAPKMKRPIRSSKQKQQKKKQSRATANLSDTAREKLLIISLKSKNTSDPERICCCPNSRCLKLYCVCFQAGYACSEKCRCKSCENTLGSTARDKAIKEVLSRRPDAFEAREKKTGEGCSCKKNRCLKKYCDCFSIAEACTDKCSCIDCGNGGTYGKSPQAPKDVTQAQFISTKAATVEHV